MKKYILTFVVTIGLLLPKDALAMLDFLKDLVEFLENCQEQVTRVVDDYNKYQMQLQEYTTTMDNVKKYKKMAQKAVDTGRKVRRVASGDYSEFFNTKLSSLQWPGLDAASDAGEYVTPQVKRQVALSYFKKRHTNKDIETTAAKDEAMNNLGIDNLAIDYANALSKRKNMLDELEKDSDDEEDSDDGKDVNELEQKYGVVNRRANHRWQDIVMFEASHISNTLKPKANNIRVDDMSEVIGEDAKEAATELQNQGVRIPENGSNGFFRDNVTVGDVYRLATSGIDALKRQDYSSAFNSMSGLYSGTGKSDPKVEETLRKISSKMSTSEYIYDRAEAGDYDSVIDKTYDEGKGYYDEINKTKKEKEKTND